MTVDLPISPERSPRSTFLSLLTQMTKWFYLFSKLGMELPLSPGFTSTTNHNTRVRQVFSLSLDGERLEGRACDGSFIYIQTTQQFLP